MNTKASVDPALLSALTFFPPLDLSLASLATVRAGMAAMIAAAPPSPDLPVARTEQIVPGPQGAPDVRVLEYRVGSPGTELEFAL